MVRQTTISKDVLGILASLACAIHCSVVPILLTLGSFTSLAWLETWWVEVLFLLTAYLFAGWSIIPRYIRQRQYFLPVALMIAGLVLLTTGLFNHVHDGHIRLVSVIGGCFLMAAHFFNYKFVHEHQTYS